MILRGVGALDTRWCNGADCPLGLWLVPAWQSPVGIGMSCMCVLEKVAAAASVHSVASWGEHCSCRYDQ